MDIAIEKVDNRAKLPKKAHNDDSGYDLFATEEKTLVPNEIKLFKLGFKMSIPTGYEAQIRPRSGLAISGITVVNSPGTIDAGYRGEVGVILGNFGEEVIEIKEGTKIAQMIFTQIECPNIEESNDIDETERGEGGFGSTGNY